MTYGELNAQIDDAERTMREAEERLRSFTDLAPALADLVGRGEAADGNVVVEWTAQGMQTLELDPRAMRLPSVDLAAAIKTAIGEAMTDLREQTRVEFDRSGLANAPRPTPDQVRQQLANLRHMTVDGARRAADDIGRAQELRRDIDSRR